MLVYLNVFHLWAPCSWAKNEQILKISRFLLLWQLGCNFFSITFFTYRFWHSLRNIKRINLIHIKHPLKRPTSLYLPTAAAPYGRKVRWGVKSASPYCRLLFKHTEPRVFLWSDPYPSRARPRRGSTKAPTRNVHIAVGLYACRCPDG